MERTGDEEYGEVRCGAVVVGAGGAGEEDLRRFDVDDGGVVNLRDATAAYEGRAGEDGVRSIVGAKAHRGSEGAGRIVSAAV